MVEIDDREPEMQLGRKSTKPRKFCAGKCQKKMVYENFYKASGEEYADGLFPICKKCVNETVDTDDLDAVKDQLRKLDRPFILNVWEASVEESKRRNMALFGTYIKNIQLGKFKKYTWKDGLLNNNIVKPEKSREDSVYIETQNYTMEELEHFASIWGEGHKPEEYRAFERKYNTLLNNYPHRTSLHIEALRNYVRYRVKEEIASARNDSKAAKEWGGLAKDAATAAKINPSQLSKADLSDGLDNFGVLVRSVEQAVDIIPILPQFKERPNDKVDFTIWCYINYERRLSGMPLVEYKEIYEFYEERKREYEENSRSEFDYSESSNSQDEEQDEDGLDSEEEVM